MIPVILSLIITYILNIIDYFQTMYAIELFGITIEANPIARVLIENGYGVLAKFIVMPIILLFIGITIYIQPYKTLQKIQSCVAYLLLMVFIAAVINNFIVLYNMGAI